MAFIVMLAVIVIGIPTQSASAVHSEKDITYKAEYLIVGNTKINGLTPYQATVEGYNQYKKWSTWQGRTDSNGGFVTKNWWWANLTQLKITAYYKNSSGKTLTVTKYIYLDCSFNDFAAINFANRTFRCALPMP